MNDQSWLLCTNRSPTLRPIMSVVVKMLEGETGTASLPSGYFMSVLPSSPSAYDVYPLRTECIV